jgi:hypothetical protein
MKLSRKLLTRTSPPILKDLARAGKRGFGPNEPLVFFIGPFLVAPAFLAAGLAAGA